MAILFSNREKRIAMLHYITLENAGALDTYVAAHPQSPVMQTSLWWKVKKDWRDRDSVLRGFGFGNEQ